jgi:pimeloyl-ACP methyl ester carboxylesterase
MMQSRFISYNSSAIHYLKNETAEKSILLCFHGYGEKASTFNFLDESVGKIFTIIAIDLPLHGETIWKEGLTFCVDDLLKIITQILDEHSQKENDFYFLGYSMGARVSLALLEQFPAQITKLLLFAPDGLRMNFWYWLCTQTVLGNRFLKFAMQHPGGILKILRLFDKMHLINASIYKFIDHYINNKQVREELYNRWTMMRKFRPHITRVKDLIGKEKIQTRMLYGKYDRIIRFERAEKLRNGIENLCTVTVIESGHQLLLQKNAATIIELIKN